MPDYDTFPFQPDWRFESEVEARAEISEADDGTERIRDLGGFSARWEVGFNNRDPDEYRFALTFYASHGKKVYFRLDDQGLGENQVGRFDSSVRRSPLSPNGVSYSFVFYTPAWTPPPAPADLGGLPDYGVGDYGG